MPYDSSLHNLMASLRNSSSYDRQNKWVPVNFFIDVEIISLEQGVEEIRECRAIQVFVGCSPWLPHLSKQPEIGEYCVLQSEPFFLARFRSDVTPFGGDGQSIVELQIVLTRRLRFLEVLLLFFEEAHYMRQRFCLKSTIREFFCETFKH